MTPISSSSLRTWSLRAGIAVFALSWFFPALLGGQFDDNVPGWMGFFSALLVPWMPDGFGSWSLNILSVASALTNVLMAAVFGALFDKSDLGPRWGWSLMIAGVMNAWWIAGPKLRGGLGGGYYLWLLSFFLVGFGLFGAEPREVVSHNQALPDEQ